MNTLIIVSLIAGVLYMAVILIMVAQLTCSGKRRIAEPIGWLFSGLFGLSFYIVFLVDYIDKDVNNMVYNYWSIAVRVSFLITLVSIEGARLYRMRQKHGC